MVISAALRISTKQMGMKRPKNVRTKTFGHRFEGEDIISFRAAVKTET